MRRLVDWKAGTGARIRYGIPAIGLFAMLAWVMPAVGQVKVEVLTLREGLGPVSSDGGHVLAGQVVSGGLQSLNAVGVTVQSKSGSTSLTLAEVLEVRFPVASSEALPLQKPVAAWVRLRDGSRIGCRQLAATPKQVKLQAVSLGDLAMPAGSVSSIRFGKASTGVIETWRELLGREIKRDRLVIQKGRTLDYLDGIVGSIDAKQINFLLDGDEIPVPLSRVYGVIFYGKSSTAASKGAVCRVQLRGGDRVELSSVELSGSTCRGKLSGGASFGVEVDRLERIDFSASRIVYLSAIAPRVVEHVPYFDVTWKYRRDQNLDGGPLKVGGLHFHRGLALHSKTRLVYSLGGRHRRFQAWMGIDALVGRRGNVRVVISADGKPLLETDVRGTDKPRLVDLDVSGRRELQILVDFGKDLDIADHLDLADARLIRQEM